MAMITELECVYNYDGQQFAITVSSNEDDYEGLLSFTGGFWIKRVRDGNGSVSMLPSNAKDGHIWIPHHKIEWVERRYHDDGTA